MLLHPDEMVLTRWVDGEIGTDDPDLSNHLATCERCQARLTALTEEAAAWQAALALTPTELGRLDRARLPSRLVAAAGADRRRNRWHLLCLGASGVAVALSWMLLTVVVGPTLAWLGQVISGSGLMLTGAIHLVGLAVTALAQLPPLPAATLITPLLAFIAGLLLAVLWLYRLRPPVPTDAIT